MINPVDNFKSMQNHAMLPMNLEDIWKNETGTVYLGYCPHCGKLNLKAKVVGHFDDWTLACPGCGKFNNCGSLRFKIQTKT